MTSSPGRICRSPSSGAVSAIKAIRLAEEPELTRCAYFTPIHAAKSFSKTPFTPGLKYDEKSGCPRICVVVTLKTNDNPSPFRVYNTHLDHVSEEARVNGMKVILDRMDRDDKRMVVPNLLMGDMNALPDSETIQSILNCKSRSFKELTSDIPVSFTLYGTRAAKIDYIFASGNLRGSDAKIWDECHDGVYLTDHYPVSVTVDFE